MFTFYWNFPTNFSFYGAFSPVSKMPFFLKDPVGSLERYKTLVEKNVFIDKGDGSTKYLRSISPALGQEEDRPVQGRDPSPHKHWGGPCWQEDCLPVTIIAILQNLPCNHCCQDVEHDHQEEQHVEVGQEVRTVFLIILGTFHSYWHVLNVIDTNL